MSRLSETVARHALYAILLLSGLVAYSQSVTIGLYVPESTDLNAEGTTALKTRLNAILSQSDVSAIGGDFLLVPTVTVDDTELIEGGLSNIWRTDIEIQLCICQISSKKKFGSISKNYRGISKKSEKDAVRKAVLSISNDPDFQIFINKCKDRVVKYYAENKNALIAKANALATQQKYDEALSILAVFPESIDGYSQVSAALKNIFTQYARKEAQEIILRAKAAMVTKDYSTASALLSQIDGDSPCASEAKNLISQLDKRYQKEIDDARAQERQDIADARAHEVKMSQMQLNAARDVATAYYNRKMPTYNYHIFR